ncbi:hypothetical protein [Iodobacter ciconiae]|uniref:Uncharacterized protein n=1 Tax=Iodobacter ciconiae TaxID=2496266 RepID=A0A3S8ZNT7_9NEIS|nr:hypothetical protein [Iodobacter ciconiae]AZN35059.1 hypothetical protein EJO50_00280 [Iodobacter ciconiae]
MHLRSKTGGCGRVISPAIRASSGRALRHLTLNGAGIACLAHFLIDKHLQAGQLQAVLSDIPAVEANDLGGSFINKARCPQNGQLCRLSGQGIGIVSASLKPTLMRGL